MYKRIVGGVLVAGAALLPACSSPSEKPAEAPAVASQAVESPQFELDGSWPKKPLPNGWEMGYVMAVAVDQRDHVFVLHSIQDDYGQEIKDPARANDSLVLSGWYDRIKKPGAVAAPPVVEFDPEGNVVRGWGGPGKGHPWTEPGPGKMWAEHSLSVDPKGNVWVVGGGHLALKFSPEGKFLMQIGERNKTNGSNDPRYLGDPASVDFDAAANEVYIADGYRNQRIIVYDMDSGAFKRFWGRYGKEPDDSFEGGSGESVVMQGTHFVHDVKVSRDGLVYGVDRHKVIQVFRPDGTFVRDAPTPVVFNAIALSTDPGQRYVYGGGLDNTPEIFMFRRSDLTQIGSFKSASQHYLAVDSKGNIFTTGLSLPQKFVLKSMPTQ